MSGYCIRAIHEDELEASAAVIRESFTTVAEAFGLTRENCPTNGAFITVNRLIDKRRSGAFMFGLFVDGEQAGYAELEPPSPSLPAKTSGFAGEEGAAEQSSEKRSEAQWLTARAASDDVELGKLAVLPRYRHRGYGRALMDYARDKAASMGYGSISIGIIDKNAVLKQWDADYGFIETGKRDFPSLPFTVCFMRLPLGGLTERWDVYDESGLPTGRTKTRRDAFGEGEYHLGVGLWIVNSAGQLLIQKRAASKRIHPGKWAITGGAALAGETGAQACVREVREELGLDVSGTGIALAHSRIHKDSLFHDFALRMNLSIEQLVLQPEEVSAVKWAAPDEIRRLFHEGAFMLVDINDMDIVLRFLEEHGRNPC